MPIITPNLNLKHLDQIEKIDDTIIALNSLSNVKSRQIDKIINSTADVDSESDDDARSPDEEELVAQTIIQKCRKHKYDDAYTLSKKIHHIDSQTVIAYKRLLSESIGTGDIPLQTAAHLILARNAVLTRNKEEALKHYQSVYISSQGAVDNDASRVWQREIGFSDKEKIGTDNILSCIALILYDKSTKRSALAHIDETTQREDVVSTVSTCFDTFRPLEAYLVGGNARYCEMTGKYNLRKVLRILESCVMPIDIKFSYVCIKDTPPAVIFNPDTALLTFDVPGEFNDSAIHQALRLSSPNVDAEEFRIAFDFTKNKTIPHLTIEKTKDYFLDWAKRSLSEPDFPESEYDDDSDECFWYGVAPHPFFLALIQFLMINEQNTLYNTGKKLMKFEASKMENNFNEYWDVNVCKTDQKIKQLLDGTKPNTLLKQIRAYDQHIRNILNNLLRMESNYLDKTYLQKYLYSVQEVATDDLMKYKRQAPLPSAKALANKCLDLLSKYNRKIAKITNNIENPKESHEPTLNSLSSETSDAAAPTSQVNRYIASNAFFGANSLASNHNDVPIKQFMTPKA